jgi:hypothetical protein
VSRRAAAARRGGRHTGSLASPVFLRRSRATARLDLHALVDHGHLRPAEGAEQHELIQIPQMPDTEELAGQLREARAEG